MGNNTYTENNGKRYDTVTGKQLVSSQISAVATGILPARNVNSIDGFINRKASIRSARHSVNRPQRSQTLMRKSVKKPLIIHAPTAIGEQLKGIHKSSLGTQPRRIELAKNTARSLHINKYVSHPHRTSISKLHSKLTVKQEDSLIRETSVTPHMIKQNSTTTITPDQKRRLLTSRMIESALGSAQSHKEVHPSIKPTATKRRKSFAKRLGVSSRSMAMSSAVLAVVLLAGFFAMHNVPNFAMRVAATRAGFDAELPGYRPAGFSFKGPINYSAGKVTVSFKSNSDTRAYDVTQQSSKWNSDALLSNYVLAEKKQYQTYQDRGRTLYIYDGSSATWVDNGIWYQIEGESQMTADQLVRIAASI